MILMAGLMLAATLSAVAGDAFTNDQAYLKSKWRADVTDESGFACRLLQDSVIL